MSEQDKKIETFSEPTKIIQPSAEFRAKARVQSLEQYQALYTESLESPETFWRRETQDLVFRKPWSRLLEWDCPDGHTEMTWLRDRVRRAYGPDHPWSERLGSAG